MKLTIKLQIRYPDTPPTAKDLENARTWGTQNINDTYEQTLEIESEGAAQVIIAKVIKAFNNF